jgi:Uma2 family endonuclease
MATVISDRTYVPADLLTLPNGKHFELVDGHLVGTDMSAIASAVATEVSSELRNFVNQHRLGTVFNAELGFQCFPDAPRKVRKPDVSFIRAGRLTDEMLAGHIPIAPDLAVEVVSEHDIYWEVEEKVEEYLRAGVPLVWVFNPKRRTVRIFRAGGMTAELNQEQELAGDDVLPGFRTPLAPLFRSPTTAP